MNLYQKIILQHNKTPFQFSKKTDASLTVEAHNPLCGDRFQLFLDIENDRIHDIHFHGYGCAISKASTSVLVKNLKGKSLEEAKVIAQQFLTLIQSDESIELKNEEFKAFEAAKNFPGREQCAILSWEEFVTKLSEL